MWIFTCLAALTTFFVEMLLLYIWFVKVYLPEKCIKPEHFIQRIKYVHACCADIKKGAVSNQAVEQLLGENSDALVEGYLLILCAAMFIYAIVSAGFLSAIVASSSAEYRIPVAIMIAIAIVLAAKDLWVRQREDMISKLDAFNNLFLALKFLKCSPQNDDAENKLEETAEPLTAWIWLAIAFALVSLILVLYVDVTNLLAGNLTAAVSLPQRLPAFLFLACAVACLLIDDLLGEKRIILAVAWMFRKRRQEEEIKIVGLSPWKEDIMRMCGKINIHAAEFRLVSGGGTNLASCIAPKKGPPIVQLDACYMDKSAQKMPPDVFCNMICFVLAHELAHIYYGDSTGKRDRLMMLVSLLVTIAGILVLTLSLGYVNTVLWITLFLIFCVYTGSVIFSAFTDNRYWGQVEEFRADRLGGRISGISANSFKQFCAYLNTDTAKKEKEDMHPQLATRVREMERYGGRRWGIHDHIRYTWRFFWNVKIYRKWRL